MKSCVYFIFYFLNFDQFLVISFIACIVLDIYFLTVKWLTIIFLLFRYSTWGPPPWLQPRWSSKSELPSKREFQKNWWSAKIWTADLLVASRLVYPLGHGDPLNFFIYYCNSRFKNLKFTATYQHDTEETRLEDWYYFICFLNNWLHFESKGIRNIKAVILMIIKSSYEKSLIYQIKIIAVFNFNCLEINVH